MFRVHVLIMVSKVERGDDMNKVSNYRRFLNYTQSDMSELLDISLQAYWKKENGKTAFSDE